MNGRERRPAETEIRNPNIEIRHKFKRRKGEKRKRKKWHGLLGWDRAQFLGVRRDKRAELALAWLLRIGEIAVFEL